MHVIAIVVVVTIVVTVGGLNETGGKGIALGTTAKDSVSIGKIGTTDVGIDNLFEIFFIENHSSGRGSACEVSESGRRLHRSWW